MSEIAVLLGFAVLAWFWFDSLKARECALKVGPRACEQNGLQFLDQTVECVSLRPARNGEGRVVLRRVYRFEFTDNGESRRAGTIVMMGGEVASIAMEPYLLH
ncbi:MAG: DUF3301 domain-containing protein [Betaproteobacteria bacterium]|nr:DUF3301 domain-containing protein [Betaproteobacteria bacterium]